MKPVRSSCSCNGFENQNDEHLRGPANRVGSRFFNVNLFPTFKGGNRTMKKISLVILALALVVGSAFAQGGKAITTKGGDTSANAVMISGEIDVDWVFRDKALEEGRWWGMLATPLKSSNFFNIYAMVRMDIAVSDGIDAVLTFENNRYTNGTAATDTQ